MAKGGDASSAATANGPPMASAAALRRELDALSARAVRERHERKVLRDRADRLQTAADTARRELQAHKMGSARVAVERDALEQEVAKLGSERSRLAIERSASERALDEAARENKRLKLELEELREEMEDASASVEAEKHAQEGLEKAGLLAIDHEAELRAKMDALSKDNLTLSTGVATLMRRCRALEAQLETAHAELAATQGENVRLEQQTRDQAARTAELEAANKELTAANVDAQLVAAAVSAAKSRAETENGDRIAALVFENAALNYRLVQRRTRSSAPRSAPSTPPPAKRRRSLASIPSLLPLTSPRTRHRVTTRRGRVAVESPAFP